MELTLQPLAKTCRASGRPFLENDRVVCHLVQAPNGEIARHDVLATEEAGYAKPGFVFCTWTVAYKARRPDENPGRTLKLTAENLFVTLADPTAEPNEANTPLLQFLALMLERKKVLRPRGMTPDGARQVYEHARTHQRYELPVGTLDAAFFVKIQGQLDLLVGAPRSRPAAPPDATNTPTASAEEATKSPENAPASPAA